MRYKVDTITTRKEDRWPGTELVECSVTPYPRTLWAARIWKADDLKDMFYVVNKENRLSEPGEDTFCPYPLPTARTIKVVEKETMFTGYLVLLEKPKCLCCGTIAHEAFHVAGMVMEDIGMPYTLDTDEAMAYMIQFIANQLHKVFHLKYRFK